jgi:hypothetical protein
VGDVADPIRISVAQLRAVAGALFDHLESAVGEEVEIRDAAFWAIPATARHNVYEQPSELSIGQLGESWANVESAVESGETLSYGLVWLADILREIGERTVR